MSLSTLSSQLSTAAPARRVATFNALHLGDNLVHLHFLRKLAQRYPEIHFTHGAQEQYLGQLHDLVADLPNLTLTNLETTGQGAINAWRGAGAHWYSHPRRNDFVSYHLEWFRHLAKQMGLESPIHSAADMLFDYPELFSLSHERMWPTGNFDFLLINSAPQSGQFTGYSAKAFDDLYRLLGQAGHTVITTERTVFSDAHCTRKRGYDITAIGRLAQSVKHIIGCVTGPMWTTWNIWNRHTVQTRILLLDHERVDLIPEHTIHTNSLTLVPELLRDRGLL